MYSERVPMRNFPPQMPNPLQVMYDFLTTHIPVSPDTRIDRAIVNHAQPSIPDATYNLMGSRVGPSYKALSSALAVRL